MKALYFGRVDRKSVEDGRDIVVGQSHSTTKTPKAHKEGLHGSVDLLDALSNAPQHILYLVEITGNVNSHKKRRAGKKRKYLAEFDASDILIQFSKQQALLHIDAMAPFCTATRLDNMNAYLNGNDNKLNKAYKAAQALEHSSVWHSIPEEDVDTLWLSRAIIDSVINKSPDFSVNTTDAMVHSIDDKITANTILTEMIESATGWDLDFSKNRTLMGKKP